MSFSFFSLDIKSFWRKSCRETSLMSFLISNNWRISFRCYSLMESFLNSFIILNFLLMFCKSFFLLIIIGCSLICRGIWENFSVMFSSCFCISGTCNEENSCVFAFQSSGILRLSSSKQLRVLCVPRKEKSVHRSWEFVSEETRTVFERCSKTLEETRIYVGIRWVFLRSFGLPVGSRRAFLDSTHLPALKAASKTSSTLVLRAD